MFLINGMSKVVLTNNFKTTQKIILRKKLYKKTVK